jgi:hypothetical protein
MNNGQQHSTNNPNHQRKALLLTLAVEIILLFLLFHISFPTPSPEKELTIDFTQKDDFDFEELKKEEKIEIPDVNKYLNQKPLANAASNLWQEENFEETFTEEGDGEGDEGTEDESTGPVFKNMDKNKPGLSDFSEKKKKKKGPEEIKKTFKGASNIQYFVPRRYNTYLINPIYTCPDFMKGTVYVKILVDRNGKVTQAEFDPERSTTDYECLIETAIKYSYRTRFNKDTSASGLQKGYIKFIF